MLRCIMIGLRHCLPWSWYRLAFGRSARQYVEDLIHREPVIAVAPAHRYHAPAELQASWARHRVGPSSARPPRFLVGRFCWDGKRCVGLQPSRQTLKARLILLVVVLCQWHQNR